MKKVFLLLLFAPSFVYASEQVIVSGMNVNISNIAIEHNALMGASDGAWNADTTRFNSPFPTAGTVGNLRVSVRIAPGASESWTFTLVKNGSDTSATCSITSGLTSCSDTSNTVSVVAEDNVIIKSEDSGNPTSTEARWSVTFTPTTDGETVLLGGGENGTLSSSGNRYVALHGNTYPDSIETDVETVVPTSGTFKSLYVELGGTPGSGNQYDFTMRKNGSNQSVTCTISNSDTTCNDTSNSFTVVAGDTVSLFVDPTSGPTSQKVHVGVVFLPDTEGEFIIGTNSDSTLQTSGDKIGLFSSADYIQANTTGEEQNLGLASEFTLKNIYVELEKAPGTGDSYDFTVRKSSTAGDDSTMASTSLTCTVSGASSTSCNSATDVTVNNNDLLALLMSANGSPSTGNNSTRISFLGFIDSNPPSPPAARRVMIVE